MSLIKFFLNRSKAENPAKINIKNIKKFIQGTYFKLIMKIPWIATKLVKQSKIEQIAWRRKQVELKSPECAKSNVCFCGCDVEGLISANPACEQKNYCFPEMMNTIEWNSFKTKNNI